jgi:hypothetical protein
VFESYLDSNDGCASFSGLQTMDPTSVKGGPICTEGTGCSEDRELLDFRSVALDNSNLADLAYTRSIDGQSNTELRFLHETGMAAAKATAAKHRGRSAEARGPARSSGGRATPASARRRAGWSGDRSHDE